LRELLELEDFVEVRPAHIGGSLCGGADMSRNTKAKRGPKHIARLHRKILVPVCENSHTCI
jgi:hypothetical protein